MSSTDDSHYHNVDHVDGAARDDHQHGALERVIDNLEERLRDLLGTQQHTIDEMLETLGLAKETIKILMNRIERLEGRVKVAETNVVVLQNRNAFLMPRAHVHGNQHPIKEVSTTIIAPMDVDPYDEMFPR